MLNIEINSSENPTEDERNSIASMLKEVAERIKMGYDNEPITNAIGKSVGSWCL